MLALPLQLFTMSHPNSLGVGSKENVHSMVRILAKQKNGLNVVHINAQSLQNKLEEFCYIFVSSNIDVICISETWFKPEISDACYNLPGYHLFRADRIRHAGGVGIYTKNNLKCKLIDKSTADDPIEFLFLEILQGNEKLLLGNVYRPNRLINTESLLSNLSALTLGYRNILISGDFNSNILIESTLVDDMRSIGLYPLNTIMPTHFSRTSDSLLDLILTAQSSKVLLYDQISAPVFSKHDLLFVSYEFIPYVSNELYTYRDFKNINYSSLNERALLVDWSQIHYMPSVDEQLEFIQENILQLFDEFVPLVTKQKTYSSNPWFTSEIQNLMSHRNVAYLRWKKYRTSVLLNAYKTLRNTVTAKIRSAKSTFYSSKFSGCIDSKSKWKEIRTIGVINNKNVHMEPIDVNELNHKFTNYPMTSPDTNYYIDIQSNTAPHQFSYSCTTQLEIVSELLKVKSNATGFDGLHPKFIKILLPIILPAITYFFNNILTKSTYPINWKYSKIMPIPKQGNDYRPIAILPYLSKIFERIMYNQMSKFLVENNLLTPRQSGFRPQHSCVSALIDVTEEIRSNMDDKNITFLVLLDHTKAFDSVDSQILTLKLRKFFNFTDTSIKLMDSYLTDRTQSVYLNDKISDVLTLRRGVPQGSILGPLLYSMYANDLPSQLRHCNVQMYADDVQLYICCKPTEINEGIRKLNTDIDNILIWASRNGLCLNPNKSKCLVLCKRTQPIDINLNIFLGDSRIETVSTAKNLGVVLNKHLNWKDHINITAGKVCGMLRNLWITRWFIPLNIRMLLAKTYLIPTLLYGCELFANNDSSLQRKLNVTFNNIARYIYGRSRYDSISSFSKQIFGISFDNYLNCRSIQYLHKIVYTQQPKYLYDKLQFLRSNRGNKIVQFRHHTLTSERHFFINTIRLWNHLPPHLQLISNAKQFKNHLFKYFEQF